MLLVAALGAGVVLAAGAASWESIVGEWYAAQLDSEDPETVRHAIVRLGEMRYEGALPELIGIVELEFHTEAREALRSLEQIFAVTSENTRREIVAALLGVLARDEHKDWANGFLPEVTWLQPPTITATGSISETRMTLVRQKSTSFSVDVFAKFERLLRAFDLGFRERAVDWIVEDIASSRAWSLFVSPEAEITYPSPSDWPEGSFSRDVMTRLLAEAKHEQTPIQPSWPFRPQGK